MSSPPNSQLRQAMAALRMSLAEIRHKEETLDATIAQFRTQLRRLPRQTIYGRAPLDMALSAMGEVEERLQDAEDTRRRLLTVKKAATDELAALESVQQVDEARKALAQLKRQAAHPPQPAETATEIRRLEQFIAQHSRRAEQTITAAFEERRNQG
jgi:chromosome segregation ATPase